MLGRPLLVDEESLTRPGPVRMHFACRTPRKLRGLVQIWFNGEGFNITIEPELPPEQLTAPALPSPHPPSPTDQDRGGEGPDGNLGGDKEADASLEDDSIDTTAWEKLGISDKGGATTRAPMPPMEPPLTGGSMELDLPIPNQYGSYLGSVTSPPVRAVAEPGAGQMVEPLGEARTPIAVSMESQPLASRSPSQGGRSSNKLGAVKQLKKVAVRKVSAEAVRVAELQGAPVTPRQAVMALAVPTSAPTALEEDKTVPVPKAKRTKTVVDGQVAHVRVSARAKGAKGNMPSLQRAQLLQAQKNLETSGNPLPRFSILDCFSDEHLGEVLVESGVEPIGEGGVSELISLVRAKELAQAALAAAAAQHAERMAVEEDPSTSLSLRPEGETTTGVATPPSPRCGKARRVAKAITSRGIRLRNRVI